MFSLTTHVHDNSLQLTCRKRNNFTAVVSAGLYYYIECNIVQRTIINSDIQMTHNK